MTELAADCDQVVAAAAMIGGISYFHEFAYDLLAENERILAATFDAAIAAHRDGHLERIIVVSSSMVYESATVFPTPEGAQLTSPPPISTYGFQKLASEYFAKGALEQYGLPYTIVRPFNCVGIGERRALRDTDVMSRQRQARPVARRPGPRPQGPQGPGPAPHPRRRVAGPALHVRRRPRPRDPAGDGVARRRSTRTSTSRPRRRRPSSSSPSASGRRSTATAARSATSPTRPSSTTSSSACPTSARPRRSSASRRRPRSRRCSTR